MNKDQIAQAIIDIIMDINPDADCSALVPEVALREQLELDSMDFLDIVMELRKKFGVEVPEAEYGKLASLASCCEYLGPKMAHI
jgi:acyl carrier protein